MNPTHAQLCYGCRQPLKWWHLKVEAEVHHRLYKFHSKCWLTFKRWSQYR